MNRRMIGFVALLIGFVVMAVLVVVSGERDSLPFLPTAAPATPVPQVFSTVNYDDIGAVRLEDPNSGRAITYALGQDGRWSSPDLAGQSLDQDEIRLMLRTIDVLPYERSFDIEEDTDLTQYGFQANTSYFFVQFVTVDDEDHFVVIGNPVDPDINPPTFYALIDNRPEVYLIEGGPIFFLVDKLLNPPLG